VLLVPTFLLNLTGSSIERGELVRLSDLEMPTNCGYFLTHPKGTVLDGIERDVADWLLKEARLIGA
jgi:hypothetical protein